MTKTKKLLFSGITILFIFVLFFLVEIGLRLFEYGGNQELFISMSGEYSAYKQSNPAVAKRYFVKERSLPAPSQDIFLKKKSDNGYRIFVLGGSSAAGYPYSENVMFSRILHRWLSNTFPEKNIEMINTAMPAVNSYTMLDFVDEILENKPDAILVYGGHNEFYGALGIGSSESLGKSPALVNFVLGFQKLKTVQLVRQFIYGLTSLFMGDKDFHPNSTLMERMVEEQSIYYKSEVYKDGTNQFKTNLTEIIKRLKNANVKILLSELVSNINHQKPFISQKGMFNADSTYKLARSLEKSGQLRKAKETYYKAKDYDLLRFRAPEEFNQVIHQLAQENQIPVVPLKEIYEKNSQNGIIGNGLILEHLHPNFKGYTLMATAFFNAMKDNGFISPKWPIFQKGDQNKKIGITSLDSSLAALKINILKGGWPFKKRSTLNTVVKNYIPENRVDSTALKVWKEDTYTLERGHVDLAQFYIKQKNYSAAFEEFNALTQLTPYNSSPYSKAAEMLIKMQRFDEAIGFLKVSLKYENSFYANKWLGQILLGQGKHAQGLNLLKEAYSLNGSDAMLLYNLSGAYFLNRQYSVALKTIENLQKISPGFPGTIKLKSRILKFIEQG